MHQDPGGESDERGAGDERGPAFGQENGPSQSAVQESGHCWGQSDGHDAQGLGSLRGRPAGGAAIAGRAGTAHEGTSAPSRASPRSSTHTLSNLRKL